MHPSLHAASTPDKPAVIIAETGEVRTYAELDAASNRVAHFLRGQGLGHDDVIAVMLDNCIDFFAIVWGAQRAGLRFVCMSTRLTADEADYIIANSGARLLIQSAALPELAGVLTIDVPRFALGGTLPGYASLDDGLDAMPATRIADERAGVDMLYSSGTTGRPKGVRIPLPEDPAIDQVDMLTKIALHKYGISAASVYLSPAPLYHAAPLRWTMRVHKIGGTVVVMRKFDPEGVLKAIERYGVTCGQYVPTHFIRMLKLPPETRRAYDLSTNRSVIHAAAPCPVPIKQAMIDWWGPIIEEYYAGSEGNGMTMIGSFDWLAHPGSVGKPVNCTAHILSDDGETELGTGQEGTVYFESETRFEYHGDAEKTRSSYNSRGWSTLGDVGYLDEEGYLYLTDRKSFMIISGGVNIYPQEIENHLITHPKVQDVAVVGGPHAEMGEEVIAVVQPVSMEDATDEFRAELERFARENLSGIKVPRRIDFLAELPRHDTGKLYKRLLRDQYWAKGN